MNSNELSVIERFRESHHAIARMLASGLTPSMIGRKTGISQRRLTLLWNDPTFQELIAVYSARIGEAWEQAHDTYADLGVRNMLLAESELNDRLENHIEDMSVGVLDRISQGRADRFGYGKNQTIEHKHDFATQLDRAIARSGTVIEGEVVSPHEPPALEAPKPSPTQPTTALAPRSFQNVLQPVRRRKVA